MRDIPRSSAAAGAGDDQDAQARRGADGTRRGRLAEQRRALPDQPGVYIFRDRRRRVIYVGKAKSIRRRVASHFNRRSASSFGGLASRVDHIDCVVTSTEAEALLTEQTFIKQYKPRFNVRLRDDKSYPYVAISLDEDFPRVYFTRERHRRGRVYFGPYSNAKRVRGTLDMLQKIFLYRSCEGPEPGRHSGSPCLDYYIKRCEAPCVDYISREQYRETIDGVIAFLNGQYRDIEERLEQRMLAAAAAEQFEQAALERNRLRSVRHLLERQMVSNESFGTMDVVAVATDGTDANAQVFQVRDGVLSQRQSFALVNHSERDYAEVAEEFILQYYTSAGIDSSGGARIPGQIVVQYRVGDKTPIAEALSERRGARVELRQAERGDKRRILELAEHNAELALDQEQVNRQRRRTRRSEALVALQELLGLDRLPTRIECYDISNLFGWHSVASMVVFERGAPKKSDYRRFRVNSVEGANDFASLEEILARRFAHLRERESSRFGLTHDRSFRTLPDLVVIDGGKGQLSTAMKVLSEFHDKGVAVISLAKRIEEVFLPGGKSAVMLQHDSAELQLLQQIRDEAHRFALANHRTRRSADLTTSIFDDMRGIGPARKRALLKHFGSPEAVIAATREELESVPGVPGKVGRDIYAALNKTGR